MSNLLKINFVAMHRVLPEEHLRLTCHLHPRYLRCLLCLHYEDELMGSSHQAQWVGGLQVGRMLWRFRLEHL